MRKIYLPLLASAALLPACGSDPVAPAPVIVTPAPVVTAPPPQVVVPQAATVVPAPAVRAGYGRIESITALPVTAAAGSSRPLRRFGIKMDDGTLQYVDTPAESFVVGDRIELTADGHIRRG